MFWLTHSISSAAMKSNRCIPLRLLGILFSLATLNFDVSILPMASDFDSGLWKWFNSAGRLPAALLPLPSNPHSPVFEFLREVQRWPQNPVGAFIRLKPIPIMPDTKLRLLVRAYGGTVAGLMDIEEASAGAPQVLNPVTKLTTVPEEHPVQNIQDVAPVQDKTLQEYRGDTWASASMVTPRFVLRLTSRFLSEQWRWVLPQVALFASAKRIWSSTSIIYRGWLIAFRYTSLLGALRLAWLHFVIVGVVFICFDSDIIIDVSRSALCSLLNLLPKGRDRLKLRLFGT